ncbi:MAG: hypothetical protein NVS4B7_10210 [Ktedonobacteraceae bacterium]
MDILYLLLPLCALLLWSISLKWVDVQRMNDLGLISVFPASLIIAPIILTVSFCLTLRRPQGRVLLLLLHVFLLIFMLYGITNFVEEVPRFTIVYRHAGFTEYIMRTGSVDPSLDAYFSWPGFFVLSALVTRLVGYHDVLGLAAWAPVFFNLIYLGPLYMIFTIASSDKHQTWLGLWFFYLTNWIGQDYFAPQALNFFLYLVIIAILLKWFTGVLAEQPSMQEQRRLRFSRFSPYVQRFYVWLTTPDTLHTPAQPQQRAALLVVLVVIFALVVFSHPLTPFFVLASVTALVILRRCAPRWLPILMAAMTAAWILFMTQAYLAGHLSDVIGSIGHVNDAISTNVTNRVVQGSPQHNFISVMRVIMTVFIWGLALIGAIRRLRKGYRDATYALLAVAPFPLLVVQPYGGEMLLRIYLFALPFMAFFAAGLFSVTRTSSTVGTSRWRTVGATCISLLLLGGFLFTRYGNERMDYVTKAELDGIHYLYSVAQPNSLFIEGWNDTPWKYQDYEKHTYYSMQDVLYNAVRTTDVDSIVRFVEKEKHPTTYLVFARTEKATADLLSGLPPGTLDRLENALLASGKFRLIYSNPDVQILLFTGGSEGGGA